MAVVERRWPPSYESKRPRTLEPWVIVAQDGADEDGGTLYTLFDEHGNVQVSAAWPHPLEERALLAGRATVRGPSWTGATTEIPEGKRRRKRMENERARSMSDDRRSGQTDGGAPVERLDETLVGAVIVDKCKIEGCTNRWVQQLGPYGRLCVRPRGRAEAGKQAERLQVVPQRAAASTQSSTAAGDTIDEDPARVLFEAVLEAREAVRELEKQIDRARSDLADLLDELARVVAAL